MRVLYVLRGLPGVGKTTWVKNNNLELYTLSSDNIRLLFQSPVLDTSGQFTIPQNNNKIWDFLFTLLEEKMERGEFCIVDATHCSLRSLEKYDILIKKYRYRAYLVDFTKVCDIRQAKIGNRKREQYKIVSDEVIERMQNQLDVCNKVPNYFKVLDPEQAIKKLKEESILDYNQFEKVVVIPDLHGCYEPIKSYFEEKPFNENYMYVFLGDFIDRGYQNKEVLEFLISIVDKPNVLMLEGNHEKWLKRYSFIDMKQEYSKEFKNNTIPQIKDINKTLLKKLCRRLAQIAYFKFGNNVYCLTHGGIPCKPSILISASEYINGVGGYGENESVYKSWSKNTPENYIQIHGHRNINDMEANYDGRNYNLNSEVEFGKDLRIAEIDKNDGVKVHFYNNPIFRKKEIVTDTLNIETTNQLYKYLNECKYINKKILDNDVVSYNFNRNAFEKGIWNNIIVKARGLFINSRTHNVTARSYDKFFNLNEREETQINNLKNNLVFPVYGYKKENGFLGLVSWDKDNNDLFIASKSTNQGPYAEMVREQFNKLENRNKIIDYLKNVNSTLVFEVIDIDKDPHIIKYDRSKLVLLDKIENDLKDFKHTQYCCLCYISDLFGIECKEMDLVFENWNELNEFLNKYENDFSIKHEGWVFEDQNNFMFKFKTPYYKYWKYLRSIKDSIAKGRDKQYEGTEQKIIDFMKNMDIEKLNNMSIIELRDLFERSNNE